MEPIPWSGRRTGVARRNVARSVLAMLSTIALVLSLGPVAQAVTPGYYLVVNRQSNECLTVQNGSHAHAADVRIAECRGHAWQEWQLVPAADGFFQVRVLHSGMCLDVAHRQMNAGADVVQGVCGDPNATSNHNQQWRLASYEGYLLLLPRHAWNKCLDKAYADVVMWTCHGAWWQQWSLR